jgi:hypothetical protein
MEFDGDGPVRQTTLLFLVIVLGATACAAEPTVVAASGSGSPSPTVSAGPSPAASPTPPAIPKKPPKTRGAASPTCIDGWTTPPSTSPMFTDPLGIVRRTTGVKGPLVVVDMRSFTGPESPPWLSSGDKAKGYLAVIQRWYIKLYAKDDPAFQGRFLVESRTFGRGLSAVAPYDTRGWHSPDWRGFQYDEGHPKNRAVPRLPGTWSGVEYDFVKGGAGLDFPGLPDQVVGCLSGT